MDCKGCTACCRWLTFNLNTPQTQKANVMAYYETRGCKVQDRGEYFSVSVPFSCDKVVPGGCSVHGTVLKPIVCIDYDCRKDRDLPRYGDIPYDYEGR